LIWPVKNSRTRLAAFGVGVNNGAAWRFGEGARMISVIMRWISATFLLVPCPVVKRVDKGRYQVDDDAYDHAQAVVHVSVILFEYWVSGRDTVI
jgi:hypothetical protein